MASAALLAIRCSSNDCADVQTNADARVRAEVCGREFERTAAPTAGLGALRALVAIPDEPAARRLADRLSGTTEEPAALALLGELAYRTRDPQVSAILADLRRRLIAGGHLAAASVVTRLEGRVAWDASNYRQAISDFDKSAKLGERAGDATLVKKALRGIFTMLYDLGDLRGAEQVLREAERNIEAADPETRALVSFDRGLLADAEGQPARARAAFLETLRSPAIKPHSELAWPIKLNLLAVALAAGDVAAAETAWRSAHETFVSGGFRDRPKSRVAFGLYTGELERVRGQPARALEALDGLAVDKPNPQMGWQIELERGRALQALRRDDDAIVAFTSATSIVEGLRGDQADDFKSWVLEKRRAPFTALFDIHARRGDGPAALAVAERVQGRTFLEAFAARDLPRDPNADPGHRIDWLKRIYPALRASPVLSASPATADGLVSTLAGFDVIAYFESDARLHVIAVRAGRVHVHTAALPLAEIKRLVAQVLAAPGDDSATKRLGEALFPGTTLPPAGATLYITPSPSLGRLPFAALQPRGRFLVEEHVLAQIPSLHALAALSRRGGRADGPAVVFANAALDLPEAEREGRSLIDSLRADGIHASLFTGAAATLPRLREARGARLLHLGVHSGVGPTGPWLGLHDGSVLAAELLDWRLDAGLVVLASCASAATPDPGLWGSVVASFLAAGSPSVVGALWSTPDRVARAFVTDFYRERPLADPARALARTQRAWIAKRRPAAEWAAFAFYGPGPRRPAIGRARERARAKDLVSATEKSPRAPAPPPPGDLIKARLEENH